MLPDGAHLREEDWTVFFLKPNGAAPLDNSASIITSWKSPVYYVINLVRTKHIAGVKRGARVKAMAIISRCPFFHIFKPFLVLALEKFFAEPSQTLLQKLFESLKSLDTSSMPQLSLAQKRILRNGDPSILFPDNDYLNTKSTLSRTCDGGQLVTEKGKYDCKLTFDGLQYMWEARVLFDEVSVPFKVPLDTFPGEYGELFVSQLVTTFHPPSQKSNEASGLMVILHSLLSERRILFLGYQLPAAEVANYVLAACSLVSPNLKGFAQRTFPYTCLTNLEQLLNCPGYIAGVTNPAFQSHDSWWDVLCDIPTGKVIISPKLNSFSPYGWNPTIAAACGSLPFATYANDDSEKEASKEKDLISKDNEFMKLIGNMIQERAPDIHIRNEFSRYVQHFIAVSASYEVDRKFNSSGGVLSRNRAVIPGRTRSNTTRETSPLAAQAISLATQANEVALPVFSDSATAVGAFGPSAVFVDDAARKKEYLMYSRRIESWKTTISFQAYCQEWELKRKQRCLIAKLSLVQARPTSANEIGSSQKQRSRLSTAVTVGAEEEPDQIKLMSDELDPSRIVDRFHVCTRLSYEDTLKQYDILFNQINSESSLYELLACLPNSEGGIIGISYGLFHPISDVRKRCYEVLNRLRRYDIGSKIIDSANPFIAYGLQRVRSEMDKGIIEDLDKKITSKELQNHLLGSTESVESVGSRASYLSYSNLKLNKTSNGPSLENIENVSAEEDLLAISRLSSLIYSLRRSKSGGMPRPTSKSTVFSIDQESFRKIDIGTSHMSLKRSIETMASRSLASVHVVEKESGVWFTPHENLIKSGGGSKGNILQQLRMERTQSTSEISDATRSNSLGRVSGQKSQELIGTIRSKMRGSRPKLLSEDSILSLPTEEGMKKDGNSRPATAEPVKSNNIGQTGQQQQ
eukprot:Partr_v1_DN28477_c5_g1_i1_m41144 putative actin cortical patch localization